MDAGAAAVSPIETLGNQMIVLLEELHNAMQYIEAQGYQVTYDDYMLYRTYFDRMRGVYAQWAPAQEDARRGNLDIAADAFADLEARIRQAGDKVEAIRSKIEAYRRDQVGGDGRRKTLRKRK